MGFVPKLVVTLSSFENSLACFLWDDARSTEQFVYQGYGFCFSSGFLCAPCLEYFIFTCSLFSLVVPLVSRVCPSDVCRIWKSGAKLRVDITLLGFENMSWERGRRSLIFKGEGKCFSVSAPLITKYCVNHNEKPQFCLKRPVEAEH